MACSTCAKKAALYGSKFAKNKSCKYTREELENKLQVAVTSNKPKQVLYITKALNTYDSNCNRYNRFIN